MRPFKEDTRIAKATYYISIAAMCISILSMCILIYVLIFKGL
jgi:hypothetical protein